MTQSTNHAKEAANRFLQIVAEGSLEELQAALATGVDVNQPGSRGTTALMSSLQSKDLNKVRLLIEHGADPELADDFNTTPLQYAVGADFADGARLLLDLNVDRGYVPRYPLKKIDYQFPAAALSTYESMPEEYRNVISEEDWKSSQLEIERSMIEMSQNPTVEPVITGVQSVEVLKLFLDAGDDLNLAPREIKRALVGLETGGELLTSRREYQRDKSFRFGEANPARMNFPFWRDMVRTGVNAYQARVKFDDQEPFFRPGAVWCYERFGSTLTPLGDGRFVQIGGEHEDYYDPDFCIYNDVVVFDGQGAFEIFGYPRDIFPPTDFHTATFCPDGIYIIGCLGYVDQRQPRTTPVFHLQTESWRIESVKTCGELPGWIHGHRAVYDLKRNVICISSGKIEGLDEQGEYQSIPNTKQFELDLDRREWRTIA